MKLKKIASLALAGIMAVSMLAGCNGNPTDPETPTDPATPATGVSASLYNELSLTAQRNITMSNSSSLDAALKKAVDDKVSESAANSVYTNVTFENCDDVPRGSAAVVRTALVDALDAVSGLGGICSKTKAGKTTTGVVVAMVGQGVSEATLLQETAGWIDNTVKNYPVEGKDGDGKDCKYTYTGSASVVDKSFVDTNGVTRTIKFVAVTVTCAAQEV